MTDNHAASSRYSILYSTVEEVQAAGGKNIQATRYSGIIFAELSEGQAAQLEEQGCTVAPVEKVRTEVVAPPVPVPVAAVPTYTPSQYLKLSGIGDLIELTDPPLYGGGINLAVVDTGIRETHELIKGRVVFSKNYTSDVMKDGLSHGTAVCSAALSVVPLCSILNLKVMDSKGDGTEEEVCMSIDDCIAMHEEGKEYAPHVINLSLGSEDTGNPNNVLRVAIRAAMDKKIWVFCAAGNGGPYTGTIMNPACEKNAIAVGSVKYLPDRNTFAASEFSSRGPTKEGIVKPDTVFFAEDLVLASSLSDTATEAKSGTSFASPFIAGGAIGYMEGLARRAVAKEPIAPGIPLELFPITTEQMVDTYLAYLCVKPVGVAPAKDNGYGWGLPYGEKVIRVLQTTPATMMLSGMLSAVMAVGMMGIMMKAVSRKPSTGGVR